MTGRSFKTELGNTGIEVSRLGLGTVKFGRNQGVKYPKAFDLPDDAALADLLALAKELGINMLDTAPAYGLSEERLGRLLQGQRDDWVIVGKVGEEYENGESDYIFTPEHFEMSLQRSLKRLDTDYIDVLMIHSDGSDMDILQRDDLLTTLRGFKERGLVRAIGASTKTVDGGITTLQEMDVVMACYNPVYTDEKAVLDYAADNGGGVLLKKALASGHLVAGHHCEETTELTRQSSGQNTGSPRTLTSTRDDDSEDSPLQSAMDFAFGHAGTNAIILGTINPDHMRANVRACVRALRE